MTKVSHNLDKNSTPSNESHISFRYLFLTMIFSNNKLELDTHAVTL